MRSCYKFSVGYSHRTPRAPKHSGSRSPHFAMLDLEFAELSDPGRVRERNEDYLGHVIPGSPGQARSHGWLFALADGVGGPAPGRSCFARRSPRSRSRGSAARKREPCLEMWSRRSCKPQTRASANLRALSGRSGAGMASTIVVCALRFDRATIAHVGDSRCYLIRTRRCQAHHPRSHHRRRPGAPRTCFPLTRPHMLPPATFSAARSG